ncbi:hypothetical protein CVT26_012914 [Gymnopilus dilepis]|uniref:DUF6589 domain-containing protein n=1 Tax=Gymnopilus dilepis TaxID=231916 RepID=A0A409Y447_9AGAR|nr:hypothetical protein CVT26_012914 [Gymnopilus dilepis]
MTHATNCAIIAIDEEGLDVQQIELLQTKLSRRGQHLDACYNDVEPSQGDDEHLKKAFASLVAEMLVRYTPDSKEWKGFNEILAGTKKMMPEDRPLPAKKTDARPFGVFDINEGSKKGIVDIMKAIRERSTLPESEWSAKTRIVLGDWLTSNNLRGAQRNRADDINSMERVEYVEELSSLWHYGLQAAHCLMRTHFGQATEDPTSLASHKGLLGRTWDETKPNYAAAKSLIRHSLIGRLLHIAMAKKGFQQWSELKSWRPNLDEIKALAEDIVLNHANTSAAERMKDAGDDWEAHNIFFIGDALLFCEFEQAVAHADPGRVLRVMKYWCFAFRGAGQHNYARECAEVLLRWKYKLTDMLRKALERAWFVNRWGLPRRWIPADLYVEQLNYWVKRVFIAQGNSVNVVYIIKKGSACVEAFRDVTERVSRFFGNPDRSRRSKEISFQEDLRTLVEHLSKNNLHGSRKVRPVLATQTAKSKGPTSAIVDVQVEGAGMWQHGKFKDLMRNTTFDPALGYPITEEDKRLDTGTAFDDTDNNPLERDSFEDVHVDEGDEAVGSLSGGGEYSTGEILL